MPHITKEEELRDWEKRFDEKFDFKPRYSEIEGVKMMEISPLYLEELKYFIHNLLQVSKASLIEEVEKMKKSKCGLCDENIPGAECRCDGDEVGYNRAIEEVINFLNQS